MLSPAVDRRPAPFPPVLGAYSRDGDDDDDDLQSPRMQGSSCKRGCPPSRCSWSIREVVGQREICKVRGARDANSCHVEASRWTITACVYAKAWSVHSPGSLVVDEDDHHRLPIGTAAAAASFGYLHGRGPRGKLGSREQT